MSDRPAADAPVLAGIRVIELSAKGPGPFGVMILADLGADVVRIDRIGVSQADEAGGLGRGRRSIGLNVKDPAGLDVLHELVKSADVLVEGYRPGVAERLGVGAAKCLELNPRLVYAHMTGWGQDGPLASTAGHDINFLAATGALYPMGSGDRPPAPPLNLVGDFGGGGLYLAIGVLAALFERERSGRGQVIDAAMVDGVAGMLTAYHGLRSAGAWSDHRESNIVDGGAPCYRTYATSDGGYVAVGCLEPGMYGLLLERLRLEPGDWPQWDQHSWPEQRERLGEIFAGNTRDHWERLFEGTDACVTPVLTLSESVGFPHLVARSMFSQRDGVAVPQPAPRLSRTPARMSSPPPEAGQHADEILAELGVAPDRRQQLFDAGIAG